MLFPAFFLADHPDAQIITCSHTESLAERRAGACATASVNTPRSLGLELSDDSQAAGRWSLKSGGSLFACGVSGALAGTRADCIVIDDAYRSIEDAYSETIRQKIWDWFYGEVLPRGKPGFRVVAIGTRFHFSDLFAELEDSGRYKVIKLSAIAEEGDELVGRSELTCGQINPIHIHFLTPKSQHPDVLPPLVWSSLYMNRPTPRDGGFFQSQSFSSPMYSVAGARSGCT